MSKKYREVRMKDDCLSYYGRIEVEYVKGSTTGFTFDLCEVSLMFGHATRLRSTVSV